jgi:hypothetical protein
VDREKVVTPRDSKNFNAPRAVNFEHKRKKTELPDSHELVIDEFAITSPKSTLFLPLDKIKTEDIQ